MLFEDTVRPEVLTKFPDLKCATCEQPLALGEEIKVQVDVSGWLLYAIHAKDCTVS